VFDESYLIDLIKTNTEYTDVDYADDLSIDLIHVPLIEPMIRVGHLGIRRQFPEDTIADGYHELENQEVLHTSIQILCLREDLSKVRTNIKKAYIGKSPYPSDGNYSSLIFLEASVIAKTSDKIWWSEIIGLHMPQIA